MGGHLAAAVLWLSAVQAPSGDVIAQQLRSTDARTVAWGAFHAGAYHRGDLIPELQRILEWPPADEPYYEERAFSGVVMDALIRLDAKLPAGVLVPHIDKHPVQTFVLLSTALDREDVLLQLLPRLSGFQWFAAANMLFEDRSPGLAEYLVRTVRLQLTVHVTDAEGIGFGSGSGMGAGVGCGMGQDPPAYPPHAEYRFELDLQPGFLVLATGPRPVFYSRRVTTSLQYRASALSIAGPSDEDRIEYLRAMATEIGGIPFHAHTEATVQWLTPDRLLQQVRQLRSEVEQRFRSLAERARQSLPMPPALVLQPPIDVHIVDERGYKAAPLPNIHQ